MASFSANQAAPATRWKAVVPSNSADLSAGVRGLYVGVAGDVAVRGDDGTDAIFAAGAGAILPLMAVRVLATGTTASGIVALY